MKRLKVHHYEITVCADQRDTLRYLSMRSYQRLSYCARQVRGAALERES